MGCTESSILEHQQEKSRSSSTSTSTSVPSADNASLSAVPPSLSADQLPPNVRGLFLEAKEYASIKGKDHFMWNHAASGTGSGSAFTGEGADARTPAQSADLFDQALERLGYTTGGVEELLTEYPEHYIFAFHGTRTESAISSIFLNGFDPARRAGQALGPGEYFDLSGGQLARSFQGTTDCCIVTLLITKDRDGNPVPEFHNHASVAVVTNPLAPLKTATHAVATPLGGEMSQPTPRPPHYSFCLPCAVASSTPLKATVVHTISRDIIVNHVGTKQCWI